MTASSYINLSMTTSVRRATSTDTTSLSSMAWRLTGSAKASNGNQRSESMVINVNNSLYNLSAGNAQVFTGDTNGFFSAVLLDGTNGGKIVKVLWTQLSGPTVDIANPGTMNASFTPLANTAGEYKFQLSVTVDDQTITSTTTVTTNIKPPAA